MTYLNKMVLLQVGSSPVSFLTDGVPAWVLGLGLIIFLIGYYVLKPALSTYNDKNASSIEKGAAVVETENKFYLEQIDVLTNELTESKKETAIVRAENDSLRNRLAEMGEELGETKGKLFSVKEWIERESRLDDSGGND